MAISVLQSHNPVGFINIQELQSADAGVSDHLLFVHSITGCDATSALNMKRKRKETLVVIESQNNFPILHVLTLLGNTHNYFAQRVKMFFWICGGKAKLLIKRDPLQEVNTEDIFIPNFHTGIATPTAMAVKYQPYRVHYIVQYWINHELYPFYLRCPE